MNVGGAFPYRNPSRGGHCGYFFLFLGNVMTSLFTLLLYYLKSISPRVPRTRCVWSLEMLCCWNPVGGKLHDSLQSIVACVLVIRSFCFKEYQFCGGPAPTASTSSSPSSSSSSSTGPTIVLSSPDAVSFLPSPSSSSIFRFVFPRRFIFCYFYENPKRKIYENNLRCLCCVVNGICHKGCYLFF